MNAENENVLSMAQTVRGFYVENQAELDVIVPAITAPMAELETRIDALLLNGAYADMDITGFAVQKEIYAKAVVDLGHKVGRACAGYYTTAAPDEGKVELLDSFHSELESKRDSAIYTAAMLISDMATPLSGMLDPHDASAAEITALGTAMLNYKNYMATPRERQANREGLIKKQDRMVKDLREFFSRVLDRLMEPLRMDNRLLYDTYHAARNIIDHPGGGGSEPYVYEGILQTLVRFTVPLPTSEVSISPGTNIKLRNNTIQNGLQLRFYFHTQSGGTDTGGMLFESVPSGDETIVTASQIGYDLDAGRVYLIAHNPAAEEQTFFIEI